MSYCRFWKGDTYLDQRFRDFQEMLLSLRLSSFLMPVDDSLIRDAVFVIQNLEQLRKCLHNTGVFIAIHLYSVDQSDFCLGVVAEWLQNLCKALLCHKIELIHVSRNI